MHWNWILLTSSGGWLAQRLNPPVCRIAACGPPPHPRLLQGRLRARPPRHRPGPPPNLCFHLDLRTWLPTWPMGSSPTRVSGGPGPGAIFPGEVPAHLPLHCFSAQVPCHLRQVRVAPFFSSKHPYMLAPPGTSQPRSMLPAASKPHGAHHPSTLLMLLCCAYIWRMGAHQPRAGKAHSPVL